MIILLSGNKQIIKEYIHNNTKIGFIPTASEVENDRSYMERDKVELSEMGYNLIEIDISNESKDEILEKFNELDTIYVAGGNSFYLLQQLKNKNVLDNLINFARTKNYIGLSAGTCIACPSIDYVQKLDDKTQALLLENELATNLVDFYVLPHYKSKEKYTKLADEIEQEYKEYKFIKLSNQQAILVDNTNNYKIVETK